MAGIDTSAYLPPVRPAIRAFVRNGIRSVWTYRGDLVVAMVSQIVQVVLLTVVWRSVYGDSGSVGGISRSRAVSYAVLAACVQSVLMPWTFSSLTDRVRGGQVGVDMARPIGLIAQCLSQNVGTMLGRLPVAVTGLTAALLMGVLTMPARPRLFFVFAPSLVLGIVLALLMNLSMSFASFWSLEIGGYMMLYRLGSALASGALVPLWFMPAWLATGLRWLPFQAQMFVPLSIYFDGASANRIAQDLVIQALWIVAVAAVLWKLWRMALRKVVVLGG